MKRILLTLLPLFFLLGMLALFGSHLNRDPHLLPSTFINKPTPQFRLKRLMHKGYFSNEQLSGHVSLVNIWATWCYTCREEHATLMAIRKTPGLSLFSIDYKDDPKKARSWLNHFGNPFLATGIDQAGQTAINWGVYGTPETYLVDKAGIIRYKHVGALTLDIWRKKMAPLVKKLQQA